jgi:uncharacterized metal-binding protein YceD (DUF177 family)
MITVPEFSRPVAVETLGADPREIEIEANEAERAALARRFGLVAIHRLRATVTLSPQEEAVTAAGNLSAAVTQSCAISGEPVEATVEEDFTILFRPQPAAAEEEVELSGAEMDVIFYDGATIDVGEAVAETLALSLDPYPRAPQAEDALREAGVKSEAEAGPFAALAALKDQLKP